MKKFNHLHVPDQWHNYFSKYPQGLSLLEALMNWITQVDDMVDNQNELNNRVDNFREELDQFIERFDPHLQEEVKNTLSEWQEDGILDIVIDEALQTQMDTLQQNTEDSLNSFSQQLAQKVNKVDHRKIYISETEPLGQNGDIWLKPEPKHLFYDKGDNKGVDWVEGFSEVQNGGGFKRGVTWDHLYVEGTTTDELSSQSHAFMVSETQVDLTNVNRFCVAYEMTVEGEPTGSTIYNGQFRIGGTKEDSEGHPIVLQEGIHEANINASSLTGLNYLKFRVYMSNASTRIPFKVKVKIYKIWGLE